MTFISPPPRADVEHSAAHLRDEGAASAPKNNPESQTPALALWPMWPDGPGAWAVVSPGALLQAARPFCRAGPGQRLATPAAGTAMPSLAAAGARVKQLIL